MLGVMEASKSADSNETAPSSRDLRPQSFLVSGRTGRRNALIFAEKDGHYFLHMLQTEASRLSMLADDVEKELSNNDLPEEVVRKIGLAVDNARTLVSQKMEQFKDLCNSTINQSESEVLPAGNGDLQSFWDVVMTQVDQVDALFKEIELLKANNWQEIGTE